MKIKICWIFFSTKKPSLFTLEGNTSSAPLLSPLFIRFVTYKRTQHTHLQNGPFDAIRFSWQANYREQGFLQTVRVFDLRVMESRVELRLSFCFVLFLRSSSLQRLGEIEGNPPPPLMMMFLYSHSPLSLSSSSSSSKQQQFGQQDGRPSVQLVGKALQGGRHCGHHRRVVRIGTFLFSFLSCLFWSSCLTGGFKTGIKNTSSRF